MDLKQLEYLVAVVEEGSINGAAKKLKMTQPPISSQMRLLEKELDCVLFTRGQRKITLTEEGNLLYHRALEMIHLNQSTITAVKDFRKAHGGTLKIGIISSVIEYAIHSWLTPFHSQYPEINFEIFEANTYELTDMLHNRLIDVALVRTPFSERDIDRISAQQERLVIVASKNYEDILDKITLKTLSHYPLILYRRWAQIIDEQFARKGLSPRIICMSDDARTCVSLASQGIGIALVPESIYLSSGEKQLFSKTVEDLPLQSSVTLIMSKKGCDTYVGKTFVKFFEQSLTLPTT
ncbi:LysR family transcriptional regulator [Anaeromicropila herbilytica]|uniref:LysR family transcriptional regulator n=1 Tax=Anaeromicropila herbilytica TaxID=2785025 RepID=A0A7R7EHZ6_9FIRM|nr:LysR family transcriptional regulator [Anaeromicropila herbilytica]BCN28772.1 LysR family transcriptional regulator [Anaeromicropila herbilytica]